MMNGSVASVAKQSFLYSYILSQPFATNVDAYPVLQNELLLESEQIEYGEHGEMVRIVQNKLSTLDYYDDEIDGEYGILTEYALKKFQSDNRIQITGESDKKTIRALINVEKDNQLKRLDHMSDTVYPGMHGKDVEIVQEALLYFGYYEGEIDGIYGPLTKKALEIAEEEHDINLADEVNQESLITLYDTKDHEEDHIEIKKETKGSTNSTNLSESSSNEEVEKEEQSKPKVVETKDSEQTNIIEVARSFIGTPYIWGGESPEGFDCSGFIQYVFQMQDMIIPRTVSDTWNFATHVDSPSVGDLVFFETYQPGPSHMGIYLGNGQFIHSSESRGVEITELDNPYWEPKYIGSKRIMID